MGGLTLTFEMGGATALLVGGGAVASRKALLVRQAGMRLVVVAPRLSEQLAAWAAAGELVWHARGYQAEDPVGAALVVAATDDRAVNCRVAADARRLGIPINVADRPEEGNCRFPAVLQHGELEVAVSTSGRLPGFAAAVRDLLAEQLDAAYAEALQLLAEEREKQLTLNRTGTYNTKLIKACLAAGLVELLRQGDRAAAVALIRATCTEQEG